jgi:hypothetical protein
MARDRWLAERAAELLPVPYFHVVFTLPQKIGVLEHRTLLGVGSSHRRLKQNDALLFQQATAELAFSASC